MGNPHTVLIDADILFFKFSIKNEIVNDWDPENITVEIDYDKAVEEFDWFVRQLMRNTNCSKCVLCVTHAQNFRYGVMPTYKHQRSTTEKPKLHPMLREYALNHPRHPSMMYKGLEADDVMGLRATESPGEYVIATLDKDLEQIPGFHFNWNNDTWVREVTELEGDRFFYMQILAGDRTDGYYGCPQIGGKKAWDIVDEVPGDGGPQWHRDMWERVVEEYKAAEWYLAYEQYLSRELNASHALINARVARMLRHGEYNFTTKEVNLWKPGN